MYEITMPKLSDTMTEGTLVAWQKAIGDHVERGEVVAEVETDKATMELEAFAAGELLEIKVEPGQTVAVGTVIGLIGESGEKVEKKGANLEKQESEPKTGNEGKGKTQAAEPEKKAPTKEKESEPEETKPEPNEPEPKPSFSGAEEVQAAPVIRQRAKALGIDLKTVTGSGPGGRIMLEDLERPETGSIDIPVSATEPAERADLPGEEGQPLSRMRAAIARTVAESWRTIPHFSVAVEVRMDAVEDLRRQLKDKGTPVSVTAVISRAAALSLQKFPRLNASLKNERVILHPEINIGIVVGLDDGLLVPVLKGCAVLSLEEIGQRTDRLVERARNRQLNDKELSGGTFSISNMGMYEVQSFNALIQPPMAAMLAVGAVRDGVIVAGGQPAAARLMTLTLSIDHRIADGVYAAQFLQTVKQFLEKPDGLTKLQDE